MERTEKTDQEQDQKKRYPRIISLLSRISFGKYNHGLYHKGSLQYATWPGGLITLLFAAVFIVYVIVVFVEIFQARSYNMVTQVVDLLEH